MAKNDGLMIAALVAVVAVVGLVVLMKSGGSGAVIYSDYMSDQPLGTNMEHYEAGYAFGPQCDAEVVPSSSFADSRRCCYDKCLGYCMDKSVPTLSGHTINDCGGTCVSSCEIYREESQKTAGRTKGLGGSTTQLFE